MVHTTTGSDVVYRVSHFNAVHVGRTNFSADETQKFGEPDFALHM